MKTHSSKQRSVSADLYDQPGHLLRRAHQIALSMFLEEVGDAITPKEFAILRMIHEKPEVDQVSLAKFIGIDTSSAALTAARLEKRGLITRVMSAVDRRLLSLRLTPDGAILLENTVNGVHTMRKRMLSRLTGDEQEIFMALLRKFVNLNNEESRAPVWIQATGDRNEKTKGTR